MHRITLLTTLSLLSISFVACIDEPDMFEHEDLRAVEIADAWDLHDPLLLPEFASCEDYWANRCAELTPEQCSVAQDRDACMPVDEHVVVFDVFAETFDTYEWTAISTGDQATSIGKDSAAAACETMAGLESEECLTLAAVAETLASKGAELLEVFPEGGFAALTIRDDILQISPLEDAKTDLVFSAASALGWTVPMIAGEHAIGHGNGVIVDNSMYMVSVRPNGSISVSSERAVFQQGPNEEARLRKFNPDGKVVFVSTRGSNNRPQIFVQHVGATTPPIQLTHDSFAPRHPAWSPDGRYIAYLGRDIILDDGYGPGHVDMLYIIDLNGHRVFGHDMYRAGYPEWSPDGTQIMINHGNWDDRELVVLEFAAPYTWYPNSFSTLVPRAVGPDDPRPTDAVYSHDGSTVYFHADAVNYTGALFQVPAAGGVPVRLDGNGTPIRRGYQVSISTDGQRLIFNSEMWRENLPGYLDEELLQLDLQSGVMTQLTSQPGNQYGWFAFNGLANEYVMQSSEVAGGRNDLFLHRNGATTPLYIADPNNEYDDYYPAWWMPQQFFRESHPWKGDKL